MKIYLDNCCYNRPFDDQNEARVHWESETILLIIQRAQQGLDEIVGSEILDFEMRRLANKERRKKVQCLYEAVKYRVSATAEILARAEAIGSNQLFVFLIVCILRRRKAPAFRCY